MTTTGESVILCEGFHDRAFWKGWLHHLGCKDALNERRKAYDPFGKPVEGGQFAFLTPSGSFVRLRPCHGDRNVLEQVTIRLKQRTTARLFRLIVNLDTDAEAGQGEGSRSSSLIQSIEQRIAAAPSDMKRLADRDYAVDDGATLISVVLWTADDPHAPHLPAKQTLERLACAALGAAYPDRAAAVAAWLASRPSAPPPDPKAHAWSHMAGWYADQHCDAFYEALWRDPAIVAPLRSRLERTGAWRIVETLVGG